VTLRSAKYQPIAITEEQDVVVWGIVTLSVRLCSILTSQLSLCEQHRYYYSLYLLYDEYMVYLKTGKYVVFFINALVFFFLDLGTQIAHGARAYTKYWSVANIIGPISKNAPFKYYLEPQLRLVDTPAVFNQFLFLGGVGYQFNPDVMFFIGPGWISTKSLNNTTIIERRLWQQLNWRVLNRPSLTLISRTRLEERSQMTQPQAAFRLRERLWLRAPLKGWKSYSFSCFDELFLNLNHPRWTSPYLFEQNRAFLGIAKQLSKSAVIDVGYLNQFIHTFNNQMDNVILLSFTMIT
jgi:hypothetical protein